MASIYKKGRDHGKKSKPFYIDYEDHLGRRRTVKGTTSKSDTMAMAVKLENEAKLIRHGLITPDQREMLAYADTAIEDFIVEFQKSLERRKRSAKHIKLVVGRVRTVIVGCKFGRLSDLKAKVIEEFMDEFCDEKGFGHKTFNHYVQALEQFATTLKKLGVPELKLPRRNCEVDVRKKRRALSQGDLEKLYESARSSGETIQGYDGETRERIYRIAYATGLRRSELASLTPASFDLRSKQPTVTIEATISKHRRKDTLPLHPELVPSLKEWLVGMAADQFLFPKLNKRRTWLMVKIDLERVGIPYSTQEGDADFHAAGRHTYITHLVKSGASLAITKRLARHSDVKTTLRYTHLDLDDQAEALKFLPLYSKTETNNEEHPPSTNDNESRED